MAAAHALVILMMDVSHGFLFTVLHECEADRRPGSSTKTSPVGRRWLRRRSPQSDRFSPPPALSPIARADHAHPTMPSTRAVSPRRIVADAAPVSAVSSSLLPKQPLHHGCAVAFRSFAVLSLLALHCVR